MENKFDSGLNLINNIPQELINKLPSIAENQAINKGKIEVVILFGQNIEEVERAVSAIGGEFENLGFGYGIVTIEPNKIRDLGAIESIQYIELPKVLFTSDIGSNRASCVITAWENYNLTGKGTLVGVIDSGIDYTHPAFRNDDGSTRIEYIYDLSAEGRVYTKEEINNALKAQNPYEVVPERDDNGHGTHVTGIAAAGGRINRDNYGVAYEASIIMVKVTRFGSANFALSTQIMRGIKFLIDKEAELKQPLSINISLSTNDGAHNGSSLLEQYIQTITELERVAIVVAAGNEGAAAHHASGDLSQNVNIPLSIANNERGIVLQLYKPLLSRISIEIKDPSAHNSGEIIIEEGFKQVRIPGCDILVYDTGPKPFDIDGEVTISLAPIRETLIGGTWSLTIRLKNQYSGIYDMWIPISEGLNPNTRFLNPDIYNTLGIPATTEGVIAVGSYNYKSNNISVFSGRGNNRNAPYIKPDIVAPGENIMSAIPNGRFDTKTGTSMAAPQVTGICALLLEWAIVKGNDAFLYGDRLKYYLDVGANKNIPELSFPNPIWGYGKVCIGETLRSISDVIESLGGMIRGENEFYESNINGIYIRIPK